jgi:hypothetical protein
MQHVGEPGTPEMKSDDKPSGGPSPVKAFFALLALLVAIGGLFLLTRSTDESDPGAAPRSDNFALTDAEAIERFNELHALFRQASRTRDQSLLSLMITSDSPLRDEATKDIAQLRRDGVLDRSRFVTEDIDIQSNRRTEIQLIQRVVIYPKFVLESSGKNITKSEPVRQLVEWTMKLEDSEWRVLDALVTKSQEVNQ